MTKTNRLASNAIAKCKYSQFQHKLRRKINQHTVRTSKYTSMKTALVLIKLLC